MADDRYPPPMSSLIKGKDWPRPEAPPPPPKYEDLVTKCGDCGLVYAAPSVPTKGVCPGCWSWALEGALADARDEADRLYGEINELREQVVDLEIGWDES